MRHFDYTELQNKTWDNEVINYLSLIYEYKGKQGAYIQQKPPMKRFLPLLPTKRRMTNSANWDICA